MRKTCPRTSSSPTDRSPSIPRRWGCCRAATGCASCNCRTARGDEHLVRFRPRQRLFGAEPQGAAGRFGPAQALPFRALRYRHHERLSRDHGGARSIARAPPRAWCAPIPTATASRTWSRSCSTSTCRSSSRPATGAPTSLATRSATMRRATCAIFIRSRRSSTSGSRARSATALAQACFDFLPTRALLDLAGWPEQDIFAHDG